MITSEYIPHDAQRRFHASTAKVKMLLGGVGVGKTLCGVHESVFALNDNPFCNHAICAVTYAMIRDVIVPEWQRWVPRELYTYKRGDQLFEMRSGQKVFLRSATEPDRARGLNLGSAWVDEIALCKDRRFWDIMRARIRDPRAKKPRIFATTTPAGYTWLIKEFQRTGVVIRARTADNIYLPDDFEAGLRASLGPEMAAQELDARIVSMRGLAWPVGKINFSVTAEEARKRCKVFFGGADFGFTNPAALIVGGIDHDGRMYLVEEWYKRGQTREAVAEAAAAMTAKWGIKCWFIDHDPEAQMHFAKKQLAVKLADKDVITGVNYTRSLLLPRADGQPRLYIAPHLKMWREEQQGYRYPDGKEIPIGDQGDHILDSTRYLCYSHTGYQKFTYKSGGNRSRYENMRAA